MVLEILNKKWRIIHINKLSVALGLLMLGQAQAASAQVLFEKIVPGIYGNNVYRVQVSRNFIEIYQETPEVFGNHVFRSVLTDQQLERYEVVPTPMGNKESSEIFLWHDSLTREIATPFGLYRLTYAATPGEIRVSESIPNVRGDADQFSFWLSVEHGVRFAGSYYEGISKVQVEGAYGWDNPEAAVNLDKLVANARFNPKETFFRVMTGRYPVQDQINFGGNHNPPVPPMPPTPPTPPMPPVPPQPPINDAVAQVRELIAAINLNWSEVRSMATSYTEYGFVATHTERGSPMTYRSHQNSVIFNSDTQNVISGYQLSRAVTDKVKIVQTRLGLLEMSVDELPEGHLLQAKAKKLFEYFSKTGLVILESRPDTSSPIVRAQIEIM